MTVDVCRRDLGKAFRRLGIETGDALADINVPASVLNKAGVIRGLNAAAIDVFGDQTGRHYGALVAPGWRRSVDEQFARKLLGTSVATSYEAVLLGRAGETIAVEIDSVRLEDHGMLVGVFGVLDFAASCLHWPDCRATPCLPRHGQKSCPWAASISQRSFAARGRCTGTGSRHRLTHLRYAA